MKTMILSLLCLLATHVAEAKNGFYPVRFSQILESAAPQHNNATSKLVYFGGPVIGNVKIVVVFWGSKVDAPTQSGIGDFYTAVTKSSYMDWLKEYNTDIKAVDGRDGTNQQIGRGSYAGAITIQPKVTSGTIDDAAIQDELQAQIDSGKLPKPDGNTLYMTYFPPGLKITAFGAASCSEFCAYHGFKGDPKSDHFYYGVMPDLGGACSFGCGFAAHMTNVTAISSHEFIEAITDPFPTPGTTPAYPQAWNTTDGSEAGDLCAGTNNSLKAGSKTFAVQSEWDNSANGCTKQTWSAN